MEIIECDTPDLYNGSRALQYKLLWFIYLYYAAFDQPLDRELYFSRFQ